MDQESRPQWATACECLARSLEILPGPCSVQEYGQRAMATHGRCHHRKLGPSFELAAQRSLPVEVRAPDAPGRGVQRPR